MLKEVGIESGSQHGPSKKVSTNKKHVSTTSRFENQASNNLNITTPMPVGVGDYLATPAHLNCLFPFPHPVLCKLDKVPTNQNKVSCFQALGEKYMADGNSRIIRRAGLAYALVTFRTKHLVSDLPSMDTFHAVSQDLTMLPTNLSVILKAEGNVASTPSSKKILADVFLGNSSYTISGLDLRAYPVVLRTAEDSPSGKKTLNMLYYLCYLFLFFYSYIGRKESDFFVAVP